MVRTALCSSVWGEKNADVSLRNIEVLRGHANFKGRLLCASPGENQMSAWGGSSRGVTHAACSVRATPPLVDGSEGGCCSSVWLGIP